MIYSDRSIDQPIVIDQMIDLLLLINCYRFNIIDPSVD